MNPFLIVVVLIAAIALWFVLRFLFVPVGGLIRSIISSTEKIINNQEEENHDEQR